MSAKVESQDRISSESSESQSIIEQLSKFDQKLDSILTKLNDLEKRMEVVENQKRSNSSFQTPLSVPTKKPVYPQQNLYEALTISSEASKSVKKEGKFFTDEQRIFLTVSLQEVYNFMDKISCKEKHEKLLQMQSLKSVISAIALREPKTSSRTNAFSPSSFA